MQFKVLDESYDKVIKSQYITVKTDCEYALEHLVPLIDKLDKQRAILKKDFYAKLEEDLKKGCIVPPLTVAINEEKVEAKENALKNKIKDAFILDGIQRLNTLKRIGYQNIDLSTPIFLNILVCESMDRLLYRMITLNNGQKPMSTRHQVEILTENIFDFNDLNITLQSEKESKKKRVIKSFKKSVIVRSYLSFISQSINIDNQKIIEEKLDALITEKIIESDIPNRKKEFIDIIDLINDLCSDLYFLKWFKVENNIVAFCAGINNSVDYISSKSKDAFKSKIIEFENIFQSIDISKVNLGKVRRKLVFYLIKNFEKCDTLSELELTDKILFEAL